MAGLWVMLAGPHDDRNHCMHISLCGLSLVRPLPSNIPSISSREAGYELAIRGAGRPFVEASDWSASEISKEY